MNTVTADWIKAAEDDLVAIEAMLPNDQLTNVVAFHAQQAVEKAFKGLREKLGLPIPRKHDLLLLYVGLSPHVTVQEDMLDSLNEIYTEARYPGDMGLLPHGKPTISEANKFYRFAKGVVKTVKTINQSEDNEQSSPPAESM